MLASSPSPKPRRVTVIALPVSLDSNVTVNSQASGKSSRDWLQRGDRIVRLANVPVYRRSDVWVLNSVHPVGAEIEVEFIRDNQLLRARGRTVPVSERLVGE